MKKTELFFAFILVPIDFLMIVLAGLSAYSLRFGSAVQDIRPVIFNLSLNRYLPILLAIGLVWVIIFIFSGLYNIREIRRAKIELRKVLLACSLGFVFIVMYIFYARDLFSSRFIVLAGWFLAITYVSLARLLIRWLQYGLHRYGIGTHQVILVGDCPITISLLREFSKNKNLGYNVVKHFKNFGPKEADELKDLLKAKSLDEIIQSDPGLDKEQMARLFDFADIHHLTFKYAADLLGAKSLRVEMSEISGIPIAEVKPTPLDGWGRILKRIFDIIGSAILIIVTSPLILITVIMIKLDSRGPIFFSRLDDGQPLYRIGQAGRKFRYLKFRSMRPNTDSMRYRELAAKNVRNDGPMTKIKDDPRITRVGKFIRRFSIDELPELFLVFIGSMSLVGPRPHLPEEVARYQNHHKKVLTIKSGMTGLAQVSGRSDLSFDDEVKLDAYYIENWSLWFDLTILLRTPLAVLKKRTAE